MTQSLESSAGISDDFAEEAYFNAICTPCIQELDYLVQRASTMTSEISGDDLVEGVHYYLENGLMVFTELYHLAKGYCCKSGCRHCAYGYKIEI